jgi:two-component system, sporulation sensor kinase D
MEFEDSGRGISGENLRKIFDPFFSTKNGTGTGLGLFISRRIVESYQGAIEAVSPQGKGATFVITFPALKT